MSFRYACFISYRRGQTALARQTIAKFYESLAGELELWLGPDLPVFFDTSNLAAGYLYNEALGAALCQSVCLVSLFTPSYFDVTHQYCAREYKGMTLLEEKRLRSLPAEEKTRGLIIPVVLRGERYLPSEIKDKRQVYNFENFILGQRDMSRHPRYGEAIRDVANYIVDRYMCLREIHDGLKDCSTFTLPSGQDFNDWLESVLTAVPFPGRELSTNEGKRQ